MKTIKLDKKILYDLSYGYDVDGSFSPEMWIDQHSDVIFKSGDFGPSFVVRSLPFGARFDVFIRPYRKRFWSVLFTNNSARYVLQSLYDFLYV